MSELKNLSAILEGGAVPAGYNGKAIGKLSKTYLKLENRKVVNLYPIRTVMHEDSRYCLYACPLKGTEIDEATLQSIKAEVDTLEIGEIRYDSVQSCGYDYYIVDPDTGRHILTGQRDMDSFNSWEEYGNSFAVGRGIWRGETDDYETADEVVGALLNKEDSPWKAIEW